MEYDSDGNLKAPEWIKKKSDNDKIFREEAAIRITKDQISPTTPLECELIIEVSDKVITPERIEPIYNSARGKFKHMSQLSITKINNKKYLVRIISGQFRCSWCENFRRYLGEQLNVKVIENRLCVGFAKTRKY